MTDTMENVGEIVEKFKGGACPYCASDVNSIALICKHCGGNLFLVRKIIEHLSHGNIEPPMKIVHPQKIDAKFMSVYLFINCAITWILLNISIGSIVSQYQIFLWISSGIYTYVSCKYYGINNLLLLLLVPCTTPFVLFSAFTIAPWLVPKNWIFLTENVWIDAFASMGVIFLSGIIFCKLLNNFDVKKYISLNPSVDYFTQYTSRSETLRKVALEVISIGSILFSIFKFILDK